MTFLPGHKQNCGENNPRYKDGRRAYRGMVDRSHCSICGKKLDPKNSQSIEVHHRDGDRTNNKPSNLMPLCNVGEGSCHRVRRAIKYGTIRVDVTEVPFPLEVKI